VENTFPMCGILSAKVAGLRMRNPAVDPAFRALDEARSRLFCNVKVKKTFTLQKAGSRLDIDMIQPRPGCDMAGLVVECPK
jgi:hypothetical protein